VSTSTESQVPAQAGAQVSLVLAEHAAEIKRLGKRVVDDVIEIGARLAACRAILKDEDRWRAWLENELRLSHQTAGRFTQIYELSLRRSNLDHLDLPVSALYLLAAPSTPPNARDAVLDLAANGEHLTHAQVKAMIAEAKNETAIEYEAKIAKQAEAQDELAVLVLGPKEHEQRIEAQRARLRGDAPDLADLVDKGSTSLEKACAALQIRKKREREETERLRHEREQVTKLLQGALTFFNPRGTDPRKCAERIFADIDLALWPAGTGDASIEVWADAARTLVELVNVRKDAERAATAADDLDDIPTFLLRSEAAPS
jgi:Protein of unknown function (DUF3102)